MYNLGFHSVLLLFQSWFVITNSVAGSDIKNCSNSEKFGFLLVSLVASLILLKNWGGKLALWSENKKSK